LAIVVALAWWLAPRAVHAAELGDTVWIPMVDPEKGAEETFALNTLALIREGEGGDADWRICRGKYRESVSRRDFFITVGRPDLARRESTRQSRHTLMVVGGLVAAVAGVWVVGATVTKGGWDPPWALGGGLIAGGLISYWASDVFAGPDLKIDEADSLIRRYNERLLDRLKEPGERDKHIQVMRSLRLAPWIAAGSAGLGAAARF
jgi:hypothetical protein